MSRPETTPRFSFGDVVRVDRKYLAYMGVEDDGSTMVVYGVRKLPHCDHDCYVYDCLKGDEECCFTGNELELVRKGGGLLENAELK